MNEGARRGVTRGYVGGLILATLISAVAGTVAVWGLLALWTGLVPISQPDMPRWMGPVTILAALGVLAWMLWLQTMSLLYGRRKPHWGYILLAALLAYALWGLMGTIAGLPNSDSWASLFAWSLIPIWAVAGILFWAVLARRVYSDRGTPKWPWERADDLGPDWANYGIDPWQSDDSPAGSEPRDIPEPPDTGGDSENPNEPDSDR